MISPTKKKTPYTVTAFICEKGNKNGDTLSFDDKIPEVTPKRATASSPNTNIPIISKNVNAKFSVTAQRANMCRQKSKRTIPPAKKASSRSGALTSENSIRNSAGNVKKFRSCIFEGGGRLSLLKPVAKSGIMNTKSGFSVLTAKKQQTDGLK